METKTKNKPVAKSLTTVAEEVIIEREFNLPVEAVWKAWSEPEVLKKWWGPNNFTSPSSTIDFRESGKYLNCMRSVTGEEFWSTGIYKEIIPLRKIVMTDSFSDEKGNVISAKEHNMPGEWPMQLIIAVYFEKAGEKTKMKLLHAGIPAEMHDDCVQGWNESFDKLEQNIK